jgi:cardiolipin synthase A/B
LATYNLIPKQPFTHNQVKLVRSGQPFFARLFQLIEEARYVIHLQFYIFDLDGTGRLVVEALQQAAKRGVSVFVVVDAYGSEQINKKSKHIFTDHGIHIKRFSPVNYNGGIKLGRRLHHKIVWVDGQYAMIGGVNIADKYSGFHGEEAWLDFALEVSGPICNDIRTVCDEVLHKRWLKHAYRNLPVTRFDQHMPYLSRIIQNDFFRRRVQISGSYRRAVRRSNQSLTIIASYFLPGNGIRRMLKNASERGVKVTIILAGLSDVPFIKPSIIWLYDWMFRNNVTIYEWNRSVLHGKLAVSDHKWVTIGSYNMNALSDYGSLELNVEVKDEAFATSVEKHLEELISEGCRQILPEEYKKSKNWFIQFSRWASYQLVRIMLRILFLFMQVKQDRRVSRF